MSHEQSETLKQQQPPKKKTSTKTIIGIILGLVFCGCIGLIAVGSIGSNSPDIKSTREARYLTWTADAILPPTNTITPNFTPTLIAGLDLPLEVKTENNLVLSISTIEVSKTLEALSDLKESKEGYFFILRGFLFNRTGDRDCAHGGDIRLSDGGETYKMTKDIQDIGKEIYSSDYPGSFLGQCLDSGQAEETFLIFDIPETSDDLWLWFENDKAQLGQMHYILNPIPTDTLTPSPTLTLTVTPTPTPPQGSTRYGINVRAGAGETFPVITQLIAESTIGILGRNEEGSWLFIETDSHKGWVAERLIDHQHVIDDLLIGDFDVSTPTVTPSSTVTSTPKPTKTPLPSYIDKPPSGVRCENSLDRIVCVGKIEYKRYIGYYSAPSNGRYIYIAINVGNIGSSNITASPIDVTLIMENGATYNYATASYYYTNAFETINIAPGNNAGGAIVFLVPNDVEPRKFRYQGGWFESDIVIDFRDPPED